MEWEQYLKRLDQDMVLAKGANVLPCIALGRLQNDGVLDLADFSDQVGKYSWA